MGVVYLGVAWDGAPVAVKVLRPDLADDEEFRRRFGREVSALVQVKGECTVRVIEADSQSATPFVVTEYAPGRKSNYVHKFQITFVSAEPAQNRSRGKISAMASSLSFGSDLLINVSRETAFRG